MEVDEIIKIIKETEIATGSFPIGSEWVISRVRTALVIAIQEGYRANHDSEG